MADWGRNTPWRQGHALTSKYRLYVYLLYKHLGR